MSIKKAQKIANLIESELSINLTSFTNQELELLKSRLEEFLELEVETDELSDPEDDLSFDEDDADEESYDEDE